MIRSQAIAEAAGYRDQKPGLLGQCGGDAMMGPAGGLGGGGLTGFEQFVHYDPADKESVKAVVEHLHNAKSDATSHGFPPGKEDLYLKIAMTDEQLRQQCVRSSQPVVFNIQQKIKELLDPNDIGDRLYSCLPSS